jgi:hypothetical protein
MGSPAHCNEVTGGFSLKKGINFAYQYRGDR